jgi:hypothetical protein
MRYMIVIEEGERNKFMQFSFDTKLNSIVAKVEADERLTVI